MPTEIDEYKALQIYQSCTSSSTNLNNNLTHNNICDPDHNLNEDQKEELSNVILGVEDAYRSRYIQNRSNNQRSYRGEELKKMEEEEETKQLKMLIIVIEEVSFYLFILNKQWQLH